MSVKMSPLVITGATGGLGYAIASHLLALTGPHGFRVSVREPSKALLLQSRGVEVRQGDYNRPDSLKRAFEGAERVLIISTSTLDNKACFQQHKSAIAVRRMAEHVAVELHLRRFPDK